MAFRGKEWSPPDAEEVASFIKDRMSLTELSMDSLKDVLSHAQFESMSAVEDDSPQVQKSSAHIATTNTAYYKHIQATTKNTDRSEMVNIVLPVYNSLHLVRECIAAVVAETHWPYHLTIVDDSSDKHTNEELQKIVASYPSQTMSLLTNRKNRGFAATVNRGVKALEATCKYTCYLNSDVLVTPYWLTKMVTALNADPRNKIVNPVTNNTALIGVGMSQGHSYRAMNKSLEMTTSRAYPEIMPTGFCFLFANELIKHVGYLDEAYANFGEETDFWMRTITYSDGKTFDRWRAVLADDTYVFHQRGASYATLGEEQHMNFRKMASGRFRQTWPTWQAWNKSIGMKDIEAIRKARKGSAVQSVLDKVITPAICFVTHSVEACGGMHLIADIVNEINDKGGDARVVQIPRPDKPPGEAIGELRIAPHVFPSAAEFIARFTSTVFPEGLVIAATSELAPVVAELCAVNPRLTPVLHAQSYEPFLVPDAALSKMLEGNFGFIPTVISTSEWITKEIKALPNFSGEVLATINPGVNRDIFYKGDRSLGDDRLTVMVAVNPQYPFKGADRGVEFIRSLMGMARKAGKELRVLATGATGIAGSPEILCQGILPRTRLARLLTTEVDLFVDPALNHSYGMPILEAIACGVPVLGWDNRGIREYLPKGYTPNDPIIVNSASAAELATRAFDVLFTTKNLQEVGQAQYKTAMIDCHDRKVSVDRFIDCLKKNFMWDKPRHTIVVVTPHLRKHGGPTTIITMANELAKRGHNVTIATVYSDINPEVVRYTDLPIVLLNQDATKLPPCDLLITNSDNPLNPNFSKLCPQAKRKIMLKLSHNPRFKSLEEMGLNCEWDAIVTSSQWLADICENPAPDWNYKPVKATRIGWFHYNFESMQRNIKRKRFVGIIGKDQVTVTTLIHAHPSKGSQDAGNIFAAIKKAHGDKVKLIGVGEIPSAEVKLQIPGMEYVQSPSRQEMADLMFKTDIWLGCSHGEGLGRLALEAMTGLAACVLTDTGAEYVADDVNALVSPVGDLNGLANKVNELILNASRRREIAIAGYSTAKELANPAEFTDTLEKVIADVFNV
jgi:GT2 family glycosyltransferase/glycosyltransferase involved in cell wall biosynthesis